MWGEQHRSARHKQQHKETGSTRLVQILKMVMSTAFAESPFCHATDLGQILLPFQIVFQILETHVTLLAFVATRLS